MRAFILAAGFGARMGLLGKVVPKPLVPLGGMPVVGFALEKLRRVGVKETVLNLHHGAEAIRREIGDRFSEIKIHYSYEEEILGTAGGLKKAEEFLRETGEPFFVLNADAVSNADLGAALAHHKEGRFLATLILRRSSETKKFGALSVDESGGLCRFLESKAPGEPVGAVTEAMFTGQSVLAPEFLDHIPAGRACGISEEVYPPLIESGARIGGILTEAYWADIGTPSRYLEAAADLLGGKFVPEFDWPPEGYVLVQGKPIAWGEGTVKPPVLVGEDVDLRKGAVAGPFTVLGSGAMLEDNASAVRTVIFSGGHVGENSRLERCIVGPDAVAVPSDATHWLEVFFFAGQMPPVPF